MTTEERILTFTQLCNKMNFILSEDFFVWLKENGFFTAPASTKYHGNYEGGLFDHSLSVAKRLVKLTMDNKLEWNRKESPFIVGMFHDLCKCDQYILTEDYSTIRVEGILAKPELHYEYNQNTLLKGHGAKSVMFLSQFITLTEEEMLCIRYHMGAFEKEEWAEYGASIEKYQNVLWTHHADMLASRVDGV